MIKVTRVITGLITIVCIIATLVAAFDGGAILASPYLITALLFNILQMQFECKLGLGTLSKEDGGQSH